MLICADHELIVVFMIGFNWFWVLSLGGCYGLNRGVREDQRRCVFSSTLNVYWVDLG